jgi:serine/threonine protein kinase
MAENPVDQVLPAPGDLIAGKYRVERLIGQGGMGAVFAAQHEILLQRVALKLLLAQYAREPDSVARFLNEARAMARIQDEHVARVMDVGTLEDGTAYMVLEYLEGMDLAKLVESRGPLPLVEAIDYTVQALEALGAAHRIGIVHRDIKPSNLFLTRRPNGSNSVKLLDFGISKGANPFEAQGSALTSTGAVMGSPMYMSPEQVRNSKDVDPRTDIWSLGVVLYELLAGVPPFNGATLGEILASIIEAEVPPLAKREDVPPAFEAVLLRCMARKPSQRFASVAELASALQPFASPPVQAAIRTLCETHDLSAPNAAPTSVFPPPAPAGTNPSASSPSQTGASWAPSTGNVRARPNEKRTSAVVRASLAASLVLGVLGVAGGALFLSKRHPAPEPAPAPALSPAPTVVAAPALPLGLPVDAGPARSPGSEAAGQSAPTSKGAIEPPPTHLGRNAAPHPPSHRGAGATDHPVPSAPPAAPTYDPSHDSRK